MIDSTMMDWVYSRPAAAAAEGEELLEDDGEGLRRMRQLSTDLTKRSMASRYNSAEMEGALRVMNHAGRILWRAAMEAVPGSAGAYNLPLAVLSKLFQRSFGVKSKLRSQATVSGMQDDNQVCNLDQYSEEEDCQDHVMEEPTPDSTSDFSNATEPQSNKRKGFFGMPSLFPSVVSDSEEDEEKHGF